MRIIVTRTGGIAGVRRTWEVRLEDQPDRQEWSALLHALPWDEPPETGAGADRFVYLIRVSRRTITLPERHLDGPWRELVERVRSAADAERDEPEARRFRGSP